MRFSSIGGIKKMLLRYRLELILIVLIGMHMHANHIILTSLFLGLIFIQLAMSIVIYKNLIGNPKRLEALLKEQLEFKAKKKTTREKLIKIEFWIVLIAILATAVMTKSIFIIGLSLLAIALELGKIYIFKKLQKESLQ